MVISIWPCLGTGLTLRNSSAWFASVRSSAALVWATAVLVEPKAKNNPSVIGQLLANILLGIDAAGALLGSVMTTSLSNDLTFSQTHAGKGPAHCLEQFPPQSVG